MCGGIYSAGKAFVFRSHNANQVLAYYTLQDNAMYVIGKVNFL